MINDQQPCSLLSTNAISLSHYFVVEWGITRILVLKAGKRLLSWEEHYWEQGCRCNIGPYGKMGGISRDYGGTPAHGVKRVDSQVEVRRTSGCNWHEKNPKRDGSYSKPRRTGTNRMAGVSGGDIATGTERPITID
ncbi:hypothetical protein ACOSP7_028460 [Xanthoceras sorbifolium]